MPRILMTYAEIAEHFGGDAAAARQSSIDMGIARYKGPDGLTYVELTAAMAHQYLRRAAADASLHVQVSALRETAEIMRESVSGTASRAA